MTYPNIKKLIENESNLRLEIENHKEPGSSSSSIFIFIRLINAWTGEVIEEVNWECVLEDALEKLDKKLEFTAKNTGKIYN